jgi:tetratricopeptide (TPR) repeat protein
MRFGLVQVARCVVLGALAVVLASTAAVAVTSGGKSEQPPAGDDPYARGKAAFEQEDWQGVIDHMTEAIEARPWHDDAHNLMGFAYRKLGDYDRALEAYDRALELNPHHRGALEYLGEAYLELDRPELAKDMLDRLATECQRIAVGAGERAWRSECEEWQELNAAYEAYGSDRSRE